MLPAWNFHRLLSSGRSTSKIASSGILFRNFYKNYTGISFPRQVRGVAAVLLTEQWNATFTLTDISNDPSGKPSEPKARELANHDAEPINALPFRFAPASRIPYFGHVRKWSRNNDSLRGAFRSNWIRGTFLTLVSVIRGISRASMRTSSNTDVQPRVVRRSKPIQPMEKKAV